MTLLTAFIIQGNSIICDGGGPDKKTGKWVGWIMKDEERWSPILNTEPIYGSKKRSCNSYEKLC